MRFWTTRLDDGIRRPALRRRCVSCSVKSSSHLLAEQGCPENTV